MKVDHFAHFLFAPAPSLAKRYPTTTVVFRTLNFLMRRGNRLRTAACAVPKQEPQVLIVLFAYQWGRSCVLSTRVPQQELEIQTDRFCAGWFPPKYLNENNPKHRTEMSAASTASASAFAISRRWPSLSRLKRTLRFLLVSTRAQPVAGWPTTTSRRPKCLASSSAKSCGDSTSETKPRRRAF